MGILDPEIPDTGYKGSVPKYTATRRAVDNSAQEARRPGQGGRRYFSDVVYSNMDGVDQGNQMSTMIPRGTTASAISQAERQAALIADIQNERFAEGDAPPYGDPDYGVSPYAEDIPEPGYRGQPGYREEGDVTPTQTGYRGQPGYREEGDVTPTQTGYRGQPGYREEGDITSEQTGYRGQPGYREEGDVTSEQTGYRGQPGYREEGDVTPSYGAGSGYRGGRFDDVDITEDLPETPRPRYGYAQGGLAQYDGSGLSPFSRFRAGRGYHGIPKGAEQEVVSVKPSYGAGSGYRGVPAPSYGAGSGYRGKPGRTGQEGIFGMRTGPKGNMIAGGSGGRGIAGGMRSGPNGAGYGHQGIVGGMRTGPNGNMIAGGMRSGPNGAGYGHQGIVADNYGGMMRRREQMEKMERDMGERNTPKNNKRLEDLLNGVGGRAPMNRQRPSGPMRNKGRRRRSDGTISEVDFGGITDALRRSRAGNRAPAIWRGFAEGGIAQTSPGQGYYLGGATDGMADEIVSTIDGEVEARLSDGEYVIPADVVSHLGNGNSAAGADKLGKMMDNVRKERTGNKKQGKKIDADKVINKMAGGIAQFDAGGQVTGQESSLSPYAGDYVVDMLGKGAAAAEMPYQAYTGPLTAGASDLQQQAFRGVGSLQTPGAMGGDYTPETFSRQQANQYMNPYLQGSLNPQLRENRREAEIQRIQDAGRLTKAGAFGGSRQAIMEAEGARNLLQSQADITARGYDTAFQNAQKQFNIEQDRGMTAQDKTNKFGFDVLTAQRNAGDTQRAIEAEGIAADKKQFEEERDYAQKQIQFQKSLLEGLPIDATSNQMSGASDLSTLMAILGATGQLGEGLADLWESYKPGGSPEADSYNPDPSDEYDGAFDDGDGGYEDPFDTDNYVDNTIQSGDTFRGASNAGANAANRDNQFGGR